MPAVTVLPASVATAEPKPSVAEVKKKLQKLNEQADQLVEKLNKLTDDLTVQKRTYEAKKRQVQAEQATFEQQRQQVAEMAATAYKTGEINSVPTLISANNPQVVLDQVSVFTQLSTTRSNQVTAFLASAQRLQRELGQVKDSLDDVARKSKELKQQRAQVDKIITQQKKLLARLGGTATSHGPIGGSYTGPATGSARTALNYAFAQLGKPYKYGAAGPDSFDCSGLTMRAWGAAGVGLPHNAAAQYSATRRVAFADLQPGDLVFFDNLGHDGIYIGGGQMIHAPHTGTVVQKATISSGYYRQNFYGAGRP